MKMLTFAIGLYCSQAFPAIQQEMSLPSAIAYAVDHSPALDIVRRDLQIRDLEWKNSYSPFLPQLDASATHGLSGNRPSSGNEPASGELNLQLTENLYDNGVSVTRYEAAQIQKQIAELGFKNERDRLCLEVALEYFRYSLAKSLLEVQEAQFGIVNKQYQTIASQYRQGVRTRKDYLKFKTEIARANIDLENARTAIEKSRVELMRILGIEPSAVQTPFQFRPVEIKPELVAKIPAKTPDVSRHYQYRLADLQRKLLGKDVDLIRREFWPQLLLSAGATYHRGDYLNSGTAASQDEITSWNALATLKMNLWDWGVRRRNISIALEKKTQGERDWDAKLNAFSAENEKLMLELKQSQHNFSLSQELLAMESSTYAFLESEYRNGKVSYLDLILGLRDLLSAKVKMYSSYFDLRGQLLKYRYHEGRLYESIQEI